MRVTSPSEEGSSDDFATAQLNNAWDMNATTDVDYSYGLTGLATGAVAGVNEAGQSLGSVPVVQGTTASAATRSSTSCGRRTAASTTASTPTGTACSRSS